jgi:hypothetical protein
MLWARPDLATLRSFAIGHTPLDLRDGGPTNPERWTLRFPSAEPPYLEDGTLKRTYTAKPLVAPFGKPVFGELAVLECLQRDGWAGVWVDTYHGAELFWRDMPQLSSKVDLLREPEALNVYRRLSSSMGSVVASSMFSLGGKHTSSSSNTRGRAIDQTPMKRLGSRRLYVMALILLNYSSRSTRDSS